MTPSHSTRRIMVAGGRLPSAVTYVFYPPGARAENMMTQHQVLQPQYEFAYVHSDSATGERPKLPGRGCPFVPVGA